MTNNQKSPSIDEILAANGITSSKAATPATAAPQQQTYEQEQKFNTQTYTQPTVQQQPQYQQVPQQYQQPAQQPVQQQYQQPAMNSYQKPAQMPQQQYQQPAQQTQAPSNYQNISNRFNNQKSESVVLSSTDMDPEKIDLSGFLTKAIGGNTRILIEPNFYHARLIKIEKCRDNMPWAEQKIQDRYHCHFVIDRDMFGKPLEKEVTLVHKFKISSGTKSYVYQAYTSLTGKYPQPEETINFLECLNKECLVDVQTRERDGVTWSKICGYRPLPK